MGGKPHPRLNMHARPIANKYREGKLKRTLKREFKREFNSAWNCSEVNEWNRPWVWGTLRTTVTSPFWVDLSLSGDMLSGRRLVAGVPWLFPLATTASWGLVHGPARSWLSLACLRVTVANLLVLDADPDCSWYSVSRNEPLGVGPPFVGWNSLTFIPGVVIVPSFYSTRLETRTKEFNMCASHWVLRNL